MGSGESPSRTAGRLRPVTTLRPARHGNSIGSSGSILSIGSSGSILSIGSTGSILSIGSAGSILSIGSAGSVLSIGSVCSLACIASLFSGFSRRSVRAWRAPGQLR
ncbi:MAG TPA: hypothetical protein VH637_05840 [Streptosporangiaceae bacterium]